MSNLVGVVADWLTAAKDAIGELPGLELPINLAEGCNDRPKARVPDPRARALLFIPDRDELKRAVAAVRVHIDGPDFLIAAALRRLLHEYCLITLSQPALWPPMDANDLAAAFADSVLSATSRVQYLVPLNNISAPKDLLPLRFAEGIRLDIPDPLDQVRYVTSVGSAGPSPVHSLWEPLEPPGLSLMWTGDVAATSHLQGFGKESTEKARLALAALRLVVGGDVASHTEARMPVPGHALATTVARWSLTTNQNPGALTRVADTHVGDIQRVYGKLPEFAQKHAMALSRFLDAGYRASVEDRVVDATIAIESVLLRGERGAQSYRFALRAALLLGTSPDDAREKFNLAKSLYALRSSIVHGNRQEVLKALAKTPDWRDRAIKLAGSIITRAMDEDGSNADSAAWKKHLDSMTAPAPTNRKCRGLHYRRTRTREQ